MGVRQRLRRRQRRHLQIDRRRRRRGPTLAGGLPETIVAANLAIAPSRPERLYALLATTVSSDYQSGEGQALYRSDDAGATWASVTDDPRPLMRIGGGDLPMVGVDPQDPDVVYSTSIVTVRSRDGGRTWTSLRGAPGGDDYQNVWIDPEDSNVVLLAADQGAVVTVDGGAPGAPGTTSPPRSSTTCRRATTSRTACAAASRRAAPCASPTVATAAP